MSVDIKVQFAAASKRDRLEIILRELAELPTHDGTLTRDFNQAEMLTSREVERVRAAFLKKYGFTTKTVTTVELVEAS